MKTLLGDCYGSARKKDTAVRAHDEAMERDAREV